mmetsp:Transcript_7218/g.12926  ORF Transcript_7218/g.12926 Transcript_7218/m.12926 type:complete len:114 (+) Transcript_7218:673-1014(+)
MSEARYTQSSWTAVHMGTTRCTCLFTCTSTIENSLPLKNSLNPFKVHPKFEEYLSTWSSNERAAHATYHIVNTSACSEYKTAVINDTLRKLLILDLFLWFQDHFKGKRKKCQD